MRFIVLLLAGLLSFSAFSGEKGGNNGGLSSALQTMLEIPAYIPQDLEEDRTEACAYLYSLTLKDLKDLCMAHENIDCVRAIKRYCGDLE